MRVGSLGWEDPLEDGMATHSTVLAWRIDGQSSLVGYSPLIIHEASCHTPCFQRSSHTAPRGFLNITVAHVFGRKEVSILKKRKSLVSGYGSCNRLSAAFCHGPVVLSVKSEEGNICWTLPSTLSARGADL